MSITHPDSPPVLVAVMDLEQNLRHATDMYDLGTPVMSNEDFDALKVQYGETTGAPFVYLGRAGLTAGVESVKHNVPMLSIPKVKTAPEVSTFFKKLIHAYGGDGEFDVTASAKDDGMAMAMEFRDGELRRGISRGTGDQGDDLTAHLRHVTNIPKTIDAPGQVEIRGELVMSWASMDIINQEIVDEGGDPIKDCYCHPRNAAAGILRQSKPDPSLLKHIRFEAYRLMTPVERVKTHVDELNWLRDKGFDVIKFTRYDIKDLIGLDTEELIEELLYYRTHSMPIDGVVIRANDCALYDQMGYDDENYLGAIAFKFPTEVKRATLLEVRWQGPGRSGTLNPVGNISPTSLEGVTISQATACNLARVAKYGLIPGVEVGIRRANDVIPELLGNIAGKLVYEDRTDKKKFVLRFLESKEPVPTLMIPRVENMGYPTECPGCGGPTVYRAPHLRCDNQACKPKLKALITYLAHRERLDLRGLGKAIAEALVDGEMVTDPLGVFRLTEDTLSALLVKGKVFGQKRARQILAAITKAKEKPFVSAFKALGCSGIGAPEIEMIELKGWSLQHLIEMACQSPDAAKTALMGLPQVGPVKAETMVEWLIEERLWLWYMPEYLKLTPVARAEGIMPLEGLKVVITGEFPELGLAREGEGGTKDLLKKQGVRVMSGVTNKIDYLIQGVGGFGTGKHADAVDLKKPILNAHGLLKLLNGSKDFMLEDFAQQDQEEVPA